MVKVLALHLDGDEVFIPFKDVRCYAFPSCGGAKLEKRKHDHNNSLHWRCPKCGGYYGEIHTGCTSE